MFRRTKADDQLKDYAAKQQEPDLMCTESGVPIANKLSSLSVGPSGPLLLTDTLLVEELQHFNRESSSKRVVHAKGCGAFGYFEVTHDITSYTKAALFSEVGQTTPVGVRFSTFAGEAGSADTVRDVRGFAIKFYTEEGNWDLVCNNTPIFFIRDPILFPSFAHTQKRNIRTNLKDADAMWDFISLRPETTHQICFLFSDRGIPDGMRHMNGYGGHAFKLVNHQGEAFYCKFHLKTDQGIMNMDVSDAAKLAGTDPDYAVRDLYNAIANGHPPSWTIKIQIMTLEDAEKADFNPFDVTKVWPHADYPLQTVGRLVLDSNPVNYRNEVDQIAFSPSHLVPGVEPSPDKMLQARMFAYADAHRHRLGPNYQQLPVNRPLFPVSNYHCGGEAPNYFPNSFCGPKENHEFHEHPYSMAGDVTRYDSSDEDNYSQAAVFWEKVLNKDEKDRLVHNIATSLVRAQEFIQKRAVENFSHVHPDFGGKLAAELMKVPRVNKRLVVRKQ